MKKKSILGLSSLIVLNSFTMFPEYFISISIIYVLIVSVIVIGNVYNFLLQGTFSNCIAVILLMASFLIFNDDLLKINVSTFNNGIINDYFGFFSKILICLSSSIYLFIIANYLKEQKLVSFEYLLLVLFAVLGLLLMCSCNDLLTGYLAIELASFPLYIMASFKKTSSYSVDSGIKYFITGAVTSSFYLLGCSFIYGFTGSINFSDLYNLSSCFNSIYIWNFNQYEIFSALNSTSTDFYSLYEPETTLSLFNLSFIEWGLSLIIFSMFVKLALAPFHLWSLDVYEGSPLSSTIFFAVISKLSIFVLLFRLYYQCFLCFKSCWQFYSVWIGVLSIFTGSFGGLTQRKLKTLLAYSSTSHMGYSLIAFSTGTYIGIQMLLFYFAIYMISGLSVWYIFLLIRLKNRYLKNKYSKELSDLVLLKKSNPGIAFTFALTMFSFAGIPPLIGFLAKVSIFLSVVGISFYYVALISIVCSVVSTFYYIRIIKVLYFESLLVGKLYYSINNIKTLFLSFFVFSLTYLFLNPNFLYLITFRSVIYFY